MIATRAIQINCQLKRREIQHLCREFPMAVRSARVSLVGFGEDDRRKQEHVRDSVSSKSKHSSSCDCNDCWAVIVTIIMWQPRSWSLDTNQQKQNPSQIIQTAQQRLQIVQTQHQNLSKRANDRVDNLQRQRNQLERVRKDVVGMERELLLLEQDTKECEQISEGYAKGKMRSIWISWHNRVTLLDNDPRHTFSFHVLMHFIFFIIRRNETKS